MFGASKKVFCSIHISLQQMLHGCYIVDIYNCETVRVGVA